MIHGGGGEAETDVEIELLLGCDLVRRSKMQEVLGSAALREISGILHECVTRFGELPIEQERGLPSEIARRALSGPIDGEHSCCRPIGGELTRPGQLHLRVVAVAGNGMRARGQAERQD